MQDETLEAHIPQLFKQLIDLDLLLDKNQDAAFVVPLFDDQDKLHQLLILMLYHLDALLDGRAGLASVTNHDFDGRAQDSFGKVLDRTWKCGTEHDCLTIWAAILQHNFDLRLESHV